MTGEMLPLLPESSQLDAAIFVLGVLGITIVATVVIVVGVLVGDYLLSPVIDCGWLDAEWLQVWNAAWCSIGLILVAVSIFYFMEVMRAI